MRMVSALISDISSDPAEDNERLMDEVVGSWILIRMEEGG